MTPALLGVLVGLITYTSSETMTRFHESNAFVRSVVGPFGSGKSSGCIMELMKRGMEQEPHKGVRSTRWAVIRNTYPQLRDTTHKTFEQWIPERLGEFNKNEFNFRVHRKLKDGTTLDWEVLFRALDRTADVGKVLSLELTGAYVNELREVPKPIFDALQGRVGRYPKKSEGGASWFGVWADSNPWAQSSEYYEVFNKQQLPGFELFEQPDGLSAEAENIANLPDRYYERLCVGKDQAWIDEFIRAKYPAADKGSIYGELLAALEARGGVSAFEHPQDGMHAVLDLGFSDSTSIWWIRFRDGLPDIIDWYEASGKSMSHYFEVLRERSWKLAKVWLPHDARAHSFQTGVSTLEQFVGEFGIGRVEIGPELSVDDGIAAGRWLLEQPIRIHARCADGLKRLRAYRYAWDETKKVYSKLPVHDWASHTADGWRYLSILSKPIAATQRQPEARRPAAVQPKKWTLDELVAEQEERDSSTRRRI